MAIICDSVILSRPPLILISHGGLTDSDEEQEKYASLTVSLTLLLESIKSDGGKELKVRGSNKAVQQLIFPWFFFCSPSQKVSAHRQTHICRRRHTHAHTHHVRRGEMAQIGRRGDKQGVSSSRKEQDSEARFISTSSGGRPPT